VPCERWISTSILVVAAGAVVGFFQCWSPALPTQLQGILPETLLKWFAIITSIASMIGTLTAPSLIEILRLQTSLKLVLVFTLLVQLVAFALLAALLPGSPVPLEGSTSMLLALLVVASIGEGAMAPVVYELSAELTYPKSEGVTGAVFSWLLNFFGVVLLAVFPVVPSKYDSLMMVGIVVLGLVSMCLVKAEYPRRQVDEGGCNAELLSY